MRTEPSAPTDANTVKRRITFNGGIILNNLNGILNDLNEINVRTVSTASST